MLFLEDPRTVFKKGLDPGQLQLLLDRYPCVKKHGGQIMSYNTSRTIINIQVRVRKILGYLTWSTCG